LEVEVIAGAYLCILEEVLSAIIIVAHSKLVVASVGGHIVRIETARCHLGDCDREIACKGRGGGRGNNRDCGIGCIGCISRCSICSGSICCGSICSISGVSSSSIRCIRCGCVCSCISGGRSHIVKSLRYRLVSVAVAILHRHLLSAVDSHGKVPDIDGSPSGLKLDGVGTSSQGGKMHEAVAFRVRDRGGVECCRALEEL
jgi:hypothetical protein